MYLSKVEISRWHPMVRKALSDCQEMHRFVTSLFGKDRTSAQALYRTNLVGDKLNIYIYSSCAAVQQPEEALHFQQRDITFWVDKLDKDQIWNFDLIASPCKKVPAEGVAHSQRRILRSPDERNAWLERKAQQFGFEILFAVEQEHVHVSGKHRFDQGGAMYHDGYRYQGALRITNADAFRDALKRGIGPGKAYGFGMMMLKH